MIKIPRKRVAVIPVYDSDETKGGILKPSSFVYLRDKTIYEIWDVERNKKMDEAEDKERVQYLIRSYRSRGYKVDYKRKTIKEADQPLDSGERCDQGVVKYIGADVKDVQIGDYVFFSGYTGTLMHIEGEGKLIILPEKFIECVFDIDKFYEVPGLYFKDRNGEYFNATYEQAMNIMSESFTDLGLAVDVVTSQPKYEDYNVNQEE